jgi:hypothetical protein
MQYGVISKLFILKMGEQRITGTDPVKHDVLTDLLFFWNIFLLQLHGKRLGQLGSLLHIFQNQCVQVLGAADFELNDAFRPLLDRHHLGILPSRRDEKLLDISHLLRLQRENSGRCDTSTRLV